jgi:hypothetical protein
MSACVRKDVDRPVDIPAVQASIVERAHRMGLFPKWTRRLFCRLSPEGEEKEKKEGLLRGRGRAGRGERDSPPSI